MAVKQKTRVIFGDFVFKGNKIAAYVKATIFLTIAIAYIFWTADVIPDIVGPLVGRIDDALIFLFAAWAIRGAINTIMERKGSFLGGKK